MTAPTIVAGHTTKADGASTTSRTINTPTHASGDYILIAVTHDSSTSANVASSGFDVLYDNVSVAGAASFTLLVKKAGASEPANYTITSTNERLVAIAFALNNAKGVNAYGTNSSGTSTTATLPAVTTTIADTLRISIVATDAGSTTTPFGSVTGHTKLAELFMSSAGGLGIYYKTIASAGTDASQTASLSASEQWLGVTLAIASVAEVRSTKAGVYLELVPTTESVLSADGVTTGAPTLGSPLIGQAHGLTATGITTGAPTLGTPSMASIYALSADDLTAGPHVLGEPSVGQNYILSADGITTGAPTLPTPTLAQSHVLTASSLVTGAPVLGEPLVGEEHNLSADDLVTGAPALGAPIISTTGEDNLSATNLVTGAPTLGNPFVGQVHGLSTVGVTTGAPTVGTPTAGHIHNLATTGITVTPVLGQPDYRNIGVEPLATNGIIATPVLGTPNLGQNHALTASGLVTGAPTFGGGIVTPSVIIGDVYVIPFEDRTYIVPFEDRVYEV